MELNKKFVNLDWKTYGSEIGKALTPSSWHTLKNYVEGKVTDRCRSKIHENKMYQKHYSFFEYFKEWLANGIFVTTLKILMNSNDNLIMQWYYDKLIKLPIKLDTL